MIELIVLIGMIVGGMELDSQPSEKLINKTVFKKARQFSEAEQAADLKQMEINSILRQMDNGQDELSRCPVNKICTNVSDLELI